MGKTLNTILAGAAGSIFGAKFGYDLTLKAFETGREWAQNPGVIEYSGKIGQFLIQYVPPFLTAAISVGGIIGIVNILHENYYSSSPKQSQVDAILREKQNKKNFNSNERLSQKLFRKGEFERAIEIYDRMIQLNPWYKWAYLDKITCLEKLGRREEADKFIKTLPNFRKRKILRHT